MHAQATSAADGKVQKVVSQLNSHILIAGSFTQTRALRGISRPLVTTGRFVYWKGHGLYWEIQKPFFQASTFTADTIINWESQGVVREMNGKENPVQRRISQVVLAALAARVDELDNYFTITWDIGASSWSSELNAAGPMVKKHISQIIMAGTDHVQKLSVRTPADDRTDVEFNNVSYSAGPSQVQCQYFYRTGAQQCTSITHR